MIITCSVYVQLMHRLINISIIKSLIDTHTHTQTCRTLQLKLKMEVLSYEGSCWGSREGFSKSLFLSQSTSGACFMQNHIYSKFLKFLCGRNNTILRFWWRLGLDLHKYLLKIIPPLYVRNKGSAQLHKKFDRFEPFVLLEMWRPADVQPHKRKPIH